MPHQKFLSMTKRASGLSPLRPNIAHPRARSKGGSSGGKPASLDLTPSRGGPLAVGREAEVAPAACSPHEATPWLRRAEPPSSQAGFRPPCLHLLRLCLRQVRRRLLPFELHLRPRREADGGFHVPLSDEASLRPAPPILPQHFRTPCSPEHARMSNAHLRAAHPACSGPE